MKDVTQVKNHLAAQVAITSALTEVPYRTMKEYTVVINHTGAHNVTINVQTRVI